MSARPILLPPVKPAEHSKTDLPIILGRPAPATRAILRDFAKQMLRDGYRYADALDLARVFLIDEALQATKGEKTAAGEKLGLSREHIRKFHARGEQVLKP